MRFIMKHMSKKMLSVILALMILLSAVSVAFSALAQEVPYVVTMGKPAIAMQSGYTLDLNKINVMFGDTEVPGDEITWTAEENSAIKFDSAAKTVTVFKSGTYILTATKANEPSSPRTIYLSASEGTPSTEVAVYEHTFTADDLTTSGEFTAESGWKLFVDEGSGTPVYQDGAIGVYSAASVYYVLDPASSAANAIKTFPDITLEATIYTKNNQQTTQGWYGLLARVNYANNVISGTPTTNVSLLYRHTNAYYLTSSVRFNISGSATSVLDILPGNKQIPRNKLVKFKLQLNEDKVNAYYDLANGNGYVATASDSNLTDDFKTALAATAGNGGTIAIYSNRNARVGINAVKASIAFTQDELDKIANACTKNEIYTVSKTKPAIAVITGKTIDLNKILVEFDDGSLALGSEINWSTTSGAIILDAAKNTLSVFKSGSHAVTATQKADQTVSKGIYIFADDVAKTQVALIDYTFSAADNGTTDANGVYTFGGDDEELFQIYLTADTAVNYDYPGGASSGNDSHDDANAIDGDGGYKHHVRPAQGIYSGSSTPFFTVNTDSKQGSIMADFADLTIVYRGNIHPNFVSKNSYTIPIAGKYHMVGSTPSFANDTYVGYNAPLSSTVKGGMYYNVGAGANTYIGASAIPNPYRAEGTVIGSLYWLTESDYDFKMQYKGNDFTISVKGETNTDDEYKTLYTTVGDTSVPEALTDIASQKGTFMASADYLSTQYFKAYIEFTADELASLEKCYVTNDYFIVSASKPAISVKLNTKVSLDNMVVEMADGTFMKGSDVVWENTNGTLQYDETDNTLAAYRNGNYAITAKKSATDTEARSVYILVNDTVEKDINIIDYTFKQSDAGVADENGIYAFGGSDGQLWKFYTEPNATVYWNACRTDGLSSGEYLDKTTNVKYTASVNSGINIGYKTGYLVLNPESKEGKIMAAFADYTIVYRANLHPNFVCRNDRTARIMGKYQMAGTTPNFANDKYLGYNAPWSNSTKGGSYYSGGKTNVGNAVTNPGYQFKDNVVVEADLDFKMQYNAGDFIFSVKGAEFDESEYRTLYTMSTYSSAPVAAKTAAAGYGTFAMYTSADEYLNSQYFRVTVSFSEEDLAKLVATDVDALYNVEQSYPAVPVKQGHKIPLSNLLVELPSGDYMVGSKLNWSCEYVGSDFFVDNTEKAVYAYGDGRYDVKVTNPADNSEVMTLYFIVSSDGIYRLFDHTFTKADLDALSATGKSDMWISKTYSAKYAAVVDGYASGVAGWPISWSNKTVALTEGKNAQFDEQKGISLYNDNTSILLLNPECYEAKVIAKFKDYNIDFTSSFRDKAINNAAWPTASQGSVGALGRVNFGGDDEFDFMNGKYLNAYEPGSLQHGAYLAMKVGMVLDINNLNIEKVSADSTDYYKGSAYTWSLNTPTENVVIDSAAQTVTANAPGIYPVTLTKDGTSKVISIVVANEPMDHHIMGIFNESSVNVNAPAGFASNNYLRFTYSPKSLPIANGFKYNIPDTYNYRFALNGDNVAYYVAPNGTASYTEIYNSATDTGLTEAYKNAIGSGNITTGTIGLYSSGTACAWFKSIGVSLEFDSLPAQISLGDCYTEDGRYIYMQVGQILDLTQSNFEAGNKYHNGANITFTNAPTGLSIINGVSITADTEGVYTLNATDGNGTDFTVIVAVSAAGAVFNNGNYKFTKDDRGTITGYSRIDTNKPYSEYVLFLSELDGEHIYEIGSALAVGNPGNKQLVNLEIEKYIEKIGSGAFIGATKLKRVDIPNTVTSIGSSAFAGATALESLFIPGSVSEIGDYAFQNCNVDVIIANPNAVFGEDAFTDGAIIYGYADSTAEEYAAANGIAFVELTGADLTKAQASYDEWVKFEADRYTKVNESVEWVISMTRINGIPEYRIMGFKFTDRSAGKFVFPTHVEITNEKGEKETVPVIIGNGAFDNLSDSRAIYAIQPAEGHTSIGMWAFRDCYNLRDVILPDTLVTVGQQAFMRCTSLVSVDIPDSVTSIGLYAFDYCSNLKEVNINPETSRLQNMGTNGVSVTETPGRVFYKTQVEKFVFPVTYEWITNGLVNQSNLKEVWIYNKDMKFTISSDKEQYYFPMNTVIHGVPGSTAEALVKADEALKDHEDPEMRKNYRGLVFKGDIEDFYTTQENVLDTEAKFNAQYIQYEVVDQDNSKALTAPYYAITGFVGKGGKVVMPAYLDVGEDKNVPIYAISNKFQSEGTPTNGIDRIINLEISEGIAEIEDEALNGANHLKSVKFPSTLLYIGEKAFMGCALTGKLEIPKNVSEIGRNAFRNNANLTDVVILNPNIKLAASLFDSTITIHGIKGSTAEAYATKNKLNFVEIAAPSATTVADFSDNGNYKFTVTDGYITGYERLDAGKEFSLKITIPANIGGVAIKGIKEGAFDLGAEATSIIAIEIQDGVTDIEKNAFKGLKKLAYVKFPNTLKVIGESAFEETSLAGDITFPESLEKIEKNAFKNLGRISSITVLGKTTVIEGTALPRNNPNLIIYGYTGSTAEEWAKNFNLSFEYLDGGPQEESEDDDFTEDPSDSVDDGDGNEVVRIIRQSNLTLIIVIAVAMLLFAILLAAVVVVLVIIKKKRDEEEMFA